MPSATLTRLALTPLALAIGVWAHKLHRLSGAVDRHATHWAVPHGREGGLLYVALGDSAAQGIGASRPERGYVGLLAARLRGQLRVPVRTINLSTSGARLGEVVQQQLPRLAELQPDVVTVAVGGNDVAEWDAVAFRGDLALLVAALPVGSYLADVPFFMHGRWERDAQHGARLVQASVEGTGLNLVRLHEAQRRQGWQAMLTQFAADWFHPNDRGHRVWADAFWSVMAQQLVPAAQPSSTVASASAGSSSARNSR